MLELRAAVQQAVKERSAVRKEGVRMREADGDHSVNLQVLPLPAAEAGKPNYLVLFESGSAAAIVPPTKLRPATGIADAKDLRIQELEHELRADREYMQTIIEEQEGVNEELQSTNEELETAKEELQSTNEELATIIEEHENRNQELNAANNDLTNLLASIDLAIVILRADLHIRRFTFAAKSLLNLIDADIGRPIGNIRSNVDIPDLEQRVQQVIETMVPQSLELQDRDGHWYALRLRPYRTLDNRIEGAIMAFIDIDSIKEAERLRQALQQEQRPAAVVRNSNDAVTLQDFAGRILAWNRRAEEMYGYSEEEALRRNAIELISDEARAEMRLLWERLRHSFAAPRTAVCSRFCCPPQY